MGRGRSAGQHKVIAASHEYCLAARHACGERVVIATDEQRRLGVRIFSGQFVSPPATIPAFGTSEGRKREATCLVSAGDLPAAIRVSSILSLQFGFGLALVDCPLSGQNDLSAAWERKGDWGMLEVGPKPRTRTPGRSWARFGVTRFLKVSGNHMQGLHDQGIKQ